MPVSPELLANSVISSISNSGINLLVSVVACKAHKTWSVDLTVVIADFTMRENSSVLHSLERPAFLI